MSRLLKTRLKGSYTVEAVLIYPFIMLLMGFFITTGIKQYQHTDKISGTCREACKPDTEKIFQLHHIVEKVKNNEG